MVPSRAALWTRSEFTVQTKPNKTRQNKTSKTKQPSLSPCLQVRQNWKALPTHALISLELAEEPQPLNPAASAVAEVARPPPDLDQELPHLKTYMASVREREMLAFEELLIFLSQPKYLPIPGSPRNITCVIRCLKGRSGTPGR